MRSPCSFDRACYEAVHAHRPKALRKQILQAIDQDSVGRLDYILSQVTPKQLRKAGTCRRDSPLHYAVRRGSLSAVRLLLDAKADINCHSKVYPNEEAKEIAYEDQTPLHYAARYNQVAVAEVLLAHRKIKSNVRDFRGHTPLEIARERQANGVVQLLMVATLMAQETEQLDMGRLGLFDASPLFERIRTCPVESLMRLDLSYNMLTVVPLVLTTMPSLTSLILSHNEIHSLPPALGGMVQLEELDVDYNRLHLLPLSITRLENLHTFLYVHNPLTLMPDQIDCRGTHEKLLDSLRQLQHQREPWNKAKLTFLGPRQSGKSTLSRTLRKEPTAPSSFINRTSLSTNSAAMRRNPLSIYRTATSMRSGAPECEERLEVSSLTLPNHVVLSLWDFGANEFIRQAYRLFLTPRGIYIITLRAMEVQRSEIDHWLQRIRTASTTGRSTILLVVTHVDDVRFTDVVKSRVEEILASYVAGERVRSYHLLDARNREQPEAVRQVLVDVTNGHNIATLELPSHWTYLGLECLHLREKEHHQYLSWEQFSAHARGASLEDAEAISVLEYLRDAGWLYYNPPSLQGPGFVVLSPRWMSQIVGCIAEFFLRNQITDGILEASHLPRAWKQYPAEYYQTFLHLMEVHEVSYSLRGQTQHFLIPSLLSGQLPPLVNEKWPVQTPKGQRQYSRIYRSRRSAKEAFPRLLIRLLHMKMVISTVKWRHGILLHTPGGGEQALVTEDKNTHDILVRVRGPLHQSPTILREIISLTDATIESLVQGFDKSQVLLPCIHCLRHNPYAEPYLFTKESVVALWTSGEAFVYCRDIPSASRCVRIDILAPDLTFGSIPVLNNLQVERKIGQGGFGAVYEGTYHDTKVAIKELHASQNEEDFASMFEEFSREVYTMRSLDHPNLVKLYGIAIHPLRMVMEFVPMDLYHLLHSDQPLSLFLRLRMALDIAQGMQYLQDISPPIMHRDLRSPNILIHSVDENMDVIAKVADFGLALSVAPRAAGFLGTWQWHAPEVLDSNSAFYDETADVYSFGILMWEIFTSGYPFEEFRFHPEYARCVGEKDGEEVWELRVQTLKKAIVEQRLRPTFTDPMNQEVPDLCQQLITSCWQQLPSDRPSFAAIADSLRTILQQLCPESYAHFATQQNDRREAEERDLPAQVSVRSLRSRMRRDRPSVSESNAFLLELKERPLSMHYCQGKMWVGCHKGLLLVYDALVAGGTLLTTHKNHMSRIYSIDSMAQQVWTASEDGSLYIFDAETAGKLRTIERAHEHHLIRFLLAVTLHDDNPCMWSCAPAQSRIIAWNEQFESIYAFDTGNAPINCLLLQGEYVWAGTHKDVLIYKLDHKNHAMQLHQTLPGHSRKINQFCVPREGEIWTCSDDGSIRVWDSEKKECTQSLEVHAGPVRCFQPVEEGCVWVGVGYKAVMCWSTELYAPQHELATSDSVLCLCQVQSEVWVGLADAKIEIFQC